MEFQLGYCSKKKDACCLPLNRGVDMEAKTLSAASWAIHPNAGVLDKSWKAEQRGTGALSVAPI